MAIRRWHEKCYLPIDPFCVNSIRKAQKIIVAHTSTLFSVCLDERQLLDRHISINECRLFKRYMLLPRVDLCSSYNFYARTC